MAMLDEEEELDLIASVINLQKEPRIFVHSKVPHLFNNNYLQRLSTMQFWIEDAF